MDDFKENLENILDYCEDVSRNINKCQSVQDFIDNRDIQGVCSFALLQIGEIVKSQYSKFENLSKGVPWREIVKSRDFLAHNYENVRLIQIWNTCTQDIPNLANVIQKALSDDF